MSDHTEMPNGSEAEKSDEDPQAKSNNKPKLPRRKRPIKSTPQKPCDVDPWIEPLPKR